MDDDFEFEMCTFFDWYIKFIDDTLVNDEKTVTRFMKMAHIIYDTYGEQYKKYCRDNSYEYEIIR